MVLLKINLSITASLFDHKKCIQIFVSKTTFSWYQNLGRIYRKYIVPASIRKAKHVITVSEFERKRIVEILKIQDSNISVVYNAFGKHFAVKKDEAMIGEVKKKYKLPTVYIFYIGNTDPKKNTRGTLKAFSDFLRQTGSNMFLVMLDYDQSELEKLLSEIGDPELISRIILTGYVVNTDLPAIYSQCGIFLYPSLRESFGIPMLEAMASGAPVITSNTSSMPEVAGDAAILVDPFKPEEITAAMIRVLADKELKAGLINKGFEQSAKFSWKAMAANVLEIYREIGTGNKTE